MYAKLYESIVRSSIWSEDNATRILWITLLAAADCEGYVFGSVDGLARLANLPLEHTAEALARLLGPDPKSADLRENPENEGRRLAEVSRGWRIVNYAYYRDLQRAEDRREKDRRKKAKQRRRKRATHSKGVPHVAPPVPKSPPSESESDSESGREKSGARPSSRRRPFTPPTVGEVQTYAAEIKAEHAVPAEFVTYWTEEQWTRANGRKLRDWRRAFRNRERDLEQRGASSRQARARTPAARFPSGAHTDQYLELEKKAEVRWNG